MGGHVCHTPETDAHFYFRPSGGDCLCPVSRTRGRRDAADLYCPAEQPAANGFAGTCTGIADGRIDHLTDCRAQFCLNAGCAGFCGKGKTGHY